MKRLLPLGLMIVVAGIISCTLSCSHRHPAAATLEAWLWSVADNTPGTIGIAFVSSDDTVTVNDGVRYPMMSVFKLHEAIAVLRIPDSKGGVGSNRVDEAIGLFRRDYMAEEEIAGIVVA